MAQKKDIVRRMFGVFFLLAAISMLVTGETVWSDPLRSHPWEFIVFWVGCFIFVGLALLMALWDMIVVRRRVRREERELVDKTLREIKHAKDLKMQKPPKNSLN